MLAFGTIGTLALLFTSAATPSAGIEAESGAITGGASRITDATATTASGSSYVKFSTPSVTSPYETIDIPDYTSAYPVPDPNHPADTKYVSTTGSDSNSGTLAAPYRHIATAVSAVANNGTVVVRGGVYREKLGTISKSITIQAYNKEKPWIDGSEVVTGWISDTNGSATIWRHDNWTYQLCQTCIEASGGVLDPAYPNAGLPDMVFATANNSLDVMKYFDQVTSKSAVGPGKFYVDYANAKLYVGDDPSSLTIESTARDQAFFGNASNIRLLGMGIRRFGSVTDPTKQPSAGARFNSTGAYIENSAFNWNASAGVMTASSNVTMKNTVAAYNGFLGLRMNNGSGSDVLTSRFAYNNFEHFGLGGVAATASGVKIANTTGVTVADSTFDNNFAPGLWFDVHVVNGIAVRNLAKNNLGTGFYYELSTGGIIASNRSINSCYGSTKSYCSGIKVSASSNTAVYNNTVIGGWSGIGVYYDGRDPLSGVSVVNNVITDSSSSAPMLHAQEVAAGTGIFGATPWFTTINGNVYRRSAASTPTNLISFDSHSGSVSTTDFSYRCIISGCTPTARSANWELTGSEPAAGASIFVNQTGGNYALSTSFVGVPLPANIAAAIGVAAGGTAVGYLR